MNVTIEKLVYGGEGLGHHEGSTVFVPYVLPGEVVAVRPTERKKKFVRGKPLHIVAPAPERVSAACPHFAACGGCHYQHIPYAAQLKYKSEILRETLARIGHVQWAGAIHAHGSPPLGYRNRAQWKVRTGGEPADSSSRSVVGYFRAGSSAVLPVEECPILAPALAETLRALAARGAAGRLPATLREVEAFCDAEGRQLLLNASFSEFGAPPRKLVESLRSALPPVESLLLHEAQRDRFELDGPGYISYRAMDRSYRVGHLSFFQVNRFLVDEMVRAVTADAAGALAMDLYAGVGLFTAPLAERFERVVAVESNEAAVRDLQANLETACARVQALVMDAEKYLAGCRESPDVVVLDPPRAGVGHAALARLIALAPQRILYLSCDPATLARDLAALTGAPLFNVAPYAITEISLFEMFPQTYHIETLVRLEKR
jgi:23S rRNA (uracil1939-C5)-methyltransferase